MRQGAPGTAGWLGAWGCGRPERPCPVSGRQRGLGRTVGGPTPCGLAKRTSVVWAPSPRGSRVQGVTLPGWKDESHFYDLTSEVPEPHTQSSTQVQGRGTRIPALGGRSVKVTLKEEQGGGEGA